MNERQLAQPSCTPSAPYQLKRSNAGQVLQLRILNPLVTAAIRVRQAILAKKEWIEAYHLQCQACYDSSVGAGLVLDGLGGGGLGMGRGFGHGRGEVGLVIDILTRG